MLWAIGGPPRLFVPAELLSLLSVEQLDTLLLHELAHLRRRDHWVRVLEFVVMGLYWWHPAVWYARRELREAEEQCCDAWVVSTLPGAGRTYASALVDTLDFLSLAQPAVPPLASGLGQIADLKRRLTMIMGGTTPRSLTWPGCLAVLCLAAFLPMLPAQPPSDDAIEIQKDDGKSQLDKEKAELDKLEADLQKKIAEIAAAKAKLKAAAEARVREKVVPNVKGWVAGQKIRVIADGENIKIITDDEDGKGKIAGTGKKAMIRMVIVVEGDVNPKDLIKKLNSVLPKGSTIQMDEQIRIHNQTLHKEAKVVVPQIREVVVPQFQFQKPPANMLGPSDKPMKAPAGVPAGPGKGQDQRINELEKKLEKVLQELQEMRKQMKKQTPPAASNLRLPAGPLAPVQPPPLNNIPAAPPASGETVPPPPAGGNPPLPPTPAPERN
jgi:hypothetical protein